MPQRTRVLGLPAQARVAVGAMAARQARLAIQPCDGRRRDRVAREPAIGDERAQDERHRRGRVLAADVEQELALLDGELACAAPITAALRNERGEPTGLDPISWTLR
jgi:hypothetical protein